MIINIEKQNKALKTILKCLVELLPKHTTNCGVHNAHPSYGDKYCTCKINEVREAVRKIEL